MKHVKHIIGAPVAQGDVLLIPIAGLPGTAMAAADTESGAFIVTHSETGHHHIVKERPTVRMFNDTMDVFRSWLVIEGEPAELEHLRNFDTHESLLLDPGVYEIRRQVEYTPEGWRRAAD